LITEGINSLSDTTQTIYLPEKVKVLARRLYRTALADEGVLISPINSLTYINQHDLANRDRSFVSIFPTSRWLDACCLAWGWTLGKQMVLKLKRICIFVIISKYEIKCLL